MACEFQIGQVVHVEYPFVIGKVSLFDGEDYSEQDTWQPGIRNEVFMDYEPDTRAVADGLGKQILSIVDIHKPGKFPTRIFYTQRWQSPDGKEFGKTKLRIATVGNFRRRVRGYSFEFTLPMLTTPPNIKVEV